MMIMSELLTVAIVIVSACTTLATLNVAAAPAAATRYLFQIPISLLPKSVTVPVSAGSVSFNCARLELGFQDQDIRVRL